MAPLHRADYLFDSITTPITFLKSVSPDKALRDASHKADKLSEEYGIKTEMNLELYKAVKEYKEKARDWEKLTNEQKRYVEKVLHEFKRAGVELPKEKQEKLQKIKNQISELERQASKNLDEDKTKVVVEEKMLKGMSNTTISKLAKVPGKEGFRYVSMKKPEILPALKLVQDEATRKKLNLALGTVSSANGPILENIVALKHELALL